MDATERLASSSAYAYTEALSLRDWAWEFLRRNADFRTAQRLAAKAVRVARDGLVTTITALDADGADAFAAWGCLFAGAPDAIAPEAQVFWQPEKAADVIRMVAFERSAGLEASVFDLQTVRCRTTLLARDGQHLLFRDRGPSLQIQVSGAALIKPVHLLSDTILSDAVVRHHLRGLRLFQHLQSSGRLPDDLLETEQRGHRLRTVLQALDGSLAGAPHREIALAIFGARRVAADWNDPGRHLQDHIRRAVHRGRELMDGGYLRLLAG